MGLFSGFLFVTAGPADRTRSGTFELVAPVADLSLFGFVFHFFIGSFHFHRFLTEPRNT